MTVSARLLLLPLKKTQKLDLGEAVHREIESAYGIETAKSMAAGIHTLTNVRNAACFPVLLGHRRADASMAGVKSQIAYINSLVFVAGVTDGKRALPNVATAPEGRDPIVWADMFDEKATLETYNFRLDIMGAMINCAVMTQELARIKAEGAVGQAGTNRIAKTYFLRAAGFFVRRDKMDYVFGGGTADLGAEVQSVCSLIMLANAQACDVLAYDETTSKAEVSFMVRAETASAASRLFDSVTQMSAHSLDVPWGKYIHPRAACLARYYAAESDVWASMHEKDQIEFGNAAKYLERASTSIEAAVTAATRDGMNSPVAKSYADFMQERSKAISAALHDTVSQATGLGQPTARAVPTIAKRSILEPDESVDQWFSPTIHDPTLDCFARL